MVSAIIAQSSQLLNFYNFMNGIKPRDLSVFSMLSGLITPISIGIHDKQVVIKLLTFSRKCIKWTEISIIIVAGLMLVTFLYKFRLGLKPPMFTIVVYQIIHGHTMRT